MNSKYIAKFIKAIIDIALVFGAFILSIHIKPDGQIDNYLTNYSQSLLAFLGIWLFVSFIFNKYHIPTDKPYHKTLLKIVQANLFILGLAIILMYGFRYLEISRFILFGTMIVATSVEIIISIMFHTIKTSKPIELLEPQILQREFEISPQQNKNKHGKEDKKISKELINYIVEESNEKALNLIKNNINLSSEHITILSTTTRFNVAKREDNSLSGLANLKRINDIRFINKFFETVNTKMSNGGIFIGCVETKNMRRRRIFNKYPPILNVIIYFFDYIIKRVFPKFKLTKKLYFFLTRGQNRVLTKAETLGRLYSCGFEIIDERKINKLFYFVAKKVKDPVYDPNPTYGPLVKLRRVGKNGKTIYVYKMRTMHPYAEYLQGYIYQKFNLKEGGKFKHDFRITTAGKIMRKFWIDELPMIINLFKGDMKIVGVRPLSKHYFSLYSEELRAKRIKHKPGLIPPFYVDSPTTLDEIQASEMKYLEKCEKRPFGTDISYFFRAIYNIVFKNKRSS